MIAYVKGELAEVSADSIVVDVSGMGYRLFVPGQVLERLPGIGSKVKLHTYLQTREDAMTLFGFLTAEELEIFKLLLSVSGVGPKAALAILSVMTTEELRFAILGDDSKAIARAPGVGAKIAKRLILELKDKISFEDAFEQKLEAAAGEAAPADRGIKNEAVLALTALGYSSTEALKALQNIEVTEDMEVETVLKQALKHMALL